MASTLPKNIRLESKPMAVTNTLSYYDTTSFGRKSMGLMSFSQHVMVMSVSQNIRTSNVLSSEEIGAKDFESRHSTQKM